MSPFSPARTAGFVLGAVVAAASVVGAAGLIWLDLPFLRVALPRVIRRTVRRRRRRQELWNGNVEPPLVTFFTDPEHIVRWAWSTRHTYRERVPRADAEHENLVVVRLRSQREVDAWLSRQRLGFAPAPA